MGGRVRVLNRMFTISSADRDRRSLRVAIRDADHPE